MKHSTRWLGTFGTLTAVSALVLTGCSAGSDSGGAASDAADGLTPVTLQLQWSAQAQFAGYYAAVDQGLYEAEGLDVTIVEGGPDIVPQDVLAAGDVDYAISWVPKVLGSIEQGANITDVAQIFERSATTQISFKDKDITTATDLAGKNVGSWGYGNEWELFAGMQKAGVAIDDISLVQQAFDMNAFLSGDIDAAQAMTYNEYAQVLETVNPETGDLYQPDDLNVIDWNTEGTAMLQDGIWANTDKLESDEGYAATTVKFIKASIEGWIYAANNPEEAAAIVTAAGSALPSGHQLWMTNEVSKLIWPSTNGVGLIDEVAWANTVDIALNTQNETGSTIITAEPPTTAYSNEYVQQALDELEADGVDVMGADWTPIDVTLTEGGE
ncbi:ABC transporter substrate-binding protein [Cryobacterium roopkundense]|uniref:Thiamine pyrimidine synthase n=1 Tax=Cryobacterium roopkundense TaxID=1001240 RepID=A0A099J3V6_9MICO|nr:ABC transporter substrate-binding protein [Cryobacterium roopkundense]KGJ72750.1 ABC transporter substrate-binding protein [Cryobacterium roopkundense]MBB5642979.1 NitT/TauT family transport system substrate-binding protein [Cryobacterium roopkundense]